MSYQDAVTCAVTEVVARVRSGHPLTTSLARQVIAETGSPARPTAVMMEAQAICRARRDNASLSAVCDALVP